MLNHPGDEYDAYAHRVLVSDCTNQTILGIDAATGERSVVVDTWPWPEPDTTTCVDDLVVEHYGQYAYATVDRSFPDPNGSDLSCFASDLVFIDTVYGDVFPIENISYRCCDDCGSAHVFYSPQFDTFHDRLLYLESDCSPDFCDNSLAASPFSGGDRERVHTLYPPECIPAEPEDCIGVPYVTPTGLTFDPFDPDHRVMVVGRSSPTFLSRLDSIDLDTGEILESFPISTMWGDLELGYVADIAVNGNDGTVFVTMSGRRAQGDIEWAVVALNRFTGDQILVYDGHPTADGQTLSCTPNASFDSRQGRLVLVEPPGGYRCQGNAFALDVATGEFSSL